MKELVRKILAEGMRLDNAVPCPYLIVGEGHSQYAPTIIQELVSHITDLEQQLSASKREVVEECATIKQQAEEIERLLEENKGLVVSFWKLHRSHQEYKSEVEKFSEKFV